MKLYYAPGACSLATHIALKEANADFNIEKVNLATKLTESGRKFISINPKGYVPALELDNGQILTEASVTLQYVADQHTNTTLIPTSGTFQRYRVLEWLNFISTELHKTLSALFNPAITPEWHENQLKTLSKRMDYLSVHLEGKTYLEGEGFSVADAYLFTILGWTRIFDIDLNPWPSVSRYIEEIAERPAVFEAMVIEGLIELPIKSSGEPDYRKAS